jgi:choline dehydrogenase
VAIAPTTTIGAKAGLSGWGYADVLPYFKRSENSWLGEGTYHGAGGPLEVRVPPMNMMYAELRAASIAAGYPATDDVHATQGEGAHRSEMTISGGRRGKRCAPFPGPSHEPAQPERADGGARDAGRL